VHEKASLLERLRIDRSEEGRTPGAGTVSRDQDDGETDRWRIIAALCGVLALGAGGLLAWQWLERAKGVSTPAGAPAIAGETHTADRSDAASGESTSMAATGAEPGRVAGGVSVLDASGYVVAQRQATVSAKNMFKVRQLLVEAGQTVKAGDIVARMDDSNVVAQLDAARAALVQATANLESARVALADARPIFERNQQQRAAQVISAQDFDNAKTTYDTAQTNYAAQEAAVALARANLAIAQRNEDDTIVRAPFSGVVTDRAAQAGEIVSPMATSGYTRTGICTIVDMDSLEAQVDVSESFINRVRPGQPAVVHLNAYPDWAIPGKVVAIIPTADRSKATVKVRVGFDVRDPRILPEMGARVSFMAEKAEKKG
jgi:RND family efflux transporter MFP subunit